MFKSGLHGKTTTARGIFARCRLLRRLKNDRSGATAIEFAIVAVPFFALMIAIIEISLVFLGSFVLENAVDQASRMVRTGQAQQQGFDKDRFKDEICGTVSGLFDCKNGLKLDVRPAENFAGAGSFDPPMNEGGGLDDSGFDFDPGAGGDVIVVRVFYVWDLFAGIPDEIGGIRIGLSNITGGGRLLMATAAFRNEPFDG